MMKTSNQNKSQDGEDIMLPTITTFAWVPPFAR
ncbi:MAG: hypothetical protein JWO15_3374, partial [Sphingomonadales bacterium]|nr:hypothetical protein [Sphingomonadales bacterium]